MVSVLFRPLKYLNITGGKKRSVDLVLPFFIALVGTMLACYLKHNYQFNINNLIKGISSLIQTLPGFYIAALAAIATFPSKNIDGYTNPPLYYGGSKLTRRQFLCYMFAYLSYVSIIYVIVSMFFSLLPINIVSKVPVFILAIFISAFTLTQIVFLTFIGLWYLGERIHINDPADNSISPN